MEPLEAYLVTVPQYDRDGRQYQKRVSCCPACEGQETLKQTNGMILCTHCFWAIELKKAS